jgi:hypothetical protein
MQNLIDGQMDVVMETHPHEKLVSFPHTVFDVGCFR